MGSKEFLRIKQYSDGRRKLAVTEIVDASFMKDYVCTKDELQIMLKSEGAYFMQFNKSNLNISRRKTKISGYRTRFWFDAEESLKMQLIIKPDKHLIFDHSDEFLFNCK